MDNKARLNEQARDRASLLSLPRQLLKVGQARRGLWHVQWIRLGFWLRPVEDLQERGRLGAHPRVDVGLQMRQLVSDNLAGSERESPIPITIPYRLHMRMIKLGSYKSHFLP